MNAWTIGLSTMSKMKQKAYNWELTFENANGEHHKIRHGCQRFSDKYNSFDDLWIEVMYANACQASWEDFEKDPAKYPRYYYPVFFEQLEDGVVEYEEDTNPYDHPCFCEEDCDTEEQWKQSNGGHCWWELLDKLEREGKVKYL